RLVNHPGFIPVLNYLYAGANVDELSQKFRRIEGVDQFQKFFSYHTVQTILEKSSAGLSHSGVDKLDPGKPYLFVANHRDIVLDAAIMQYLLSSEGYKTSQITFSENLMMDQLLLDLGKLNKMFTFYRGGSKITQYRNAMINSAYINHVLKEQKESIWIAQRNGRTKNGDDRTQKGLIKMLAMGGENICDSLAELNVVPVSISYEIEPCDILKVRELYMNQREKYVKAPNEDLTSILAGIKGEKGGVHLTFGTPLNDFLFHLNSEKLHDNEVIEKITTEIDRHIFRGYKLWPNNYIAADLLEGNSRLKQYYNEAQKLSFEQTMLAKISSLKGMDPEEVKDIYLKIYANPVFNCL
ncbi:MAG: acyltransferase, partial [Bacteroides sp.]|nr:acyltransferase [Bacteroides sp.]